MAYTVLEPEAKGYDIIEPEKSKGYDVIEPDKQTSPTVISQWNPTLIQKIEVLGRSIRQSNPVETLLGRTQEEIASIPAAESATTTHDAGVMGLFTSKKPLVEMYPESDTSVSAGIHNWAAGVVNSIASPGGLATLAIGGAPSTPTIVNKALGLTFGVQGAKVSYDSIKDLVTRHRELNPAQTVGDIGNLVNGLFMFLGGAAAVKTKPTIGEVLAPETTKAVESQKAVVPEPTPVIEKAAEPQSPIPEPITLPDKPQTLEQPISEPSPSQPVISEKPTVAKEPWQMSKSEYVESRPDNSVGNEVAKSTAEIDVKKRGSGYYAVKVKDAWRNSAGKIAEPERWQVKRKLSESEKLQDHKEWIEAALKAGKPIPAEVLADYPDLKPPEVKPAQPPATAQVGESNPNESEWLYGKTADELSDKELKSEWLRMGGTPGKVKTAKTREELLAGVRGQIDFASKYDQAPGNFNKPKWAEEQPTPPPTAVTKGKAVEPLSDFEASQLGILKMKREQGRAMTDAQKASLAKLEARSASGKVETTGKGGQGVKLADAMIDAARKSSEEFRARISNVKYGDIHKNEITFDVDGKPHVGTLKGRNKDFVLGHSKEADAAIAARTFFEGDAQPTPQQGAKGADPIETLNKSKAVTVTLPEDATMFQVSHKKGQWSEPMSPDALSKAGKGKVANTMQGTDPIAIRGVSVGKSKEVKVSKGEVKVSDFPKEQMSRGAGAAAGGEPGTYSAIQQMADQLEATGKENAPINERIDAIDKVKAKASDLKDGVKSALTNVLAIKNALWDSYSKLAPYTEMKSIVGRWFYANQRADFEAREFGKQIVKAVPNKMRREAITNWIQADGDAGVLKDRAAASKGSLKQGYEAAQNLTPRETEIAQMIREYYDKQLEKGISEGMLKDGLENYITQVWKKENPITRKLMNDLVNSKLQPNFKYARQRMFSSYFEGEQAGYKPSKDAGALVANYDQSFNKSLAARAFIKDLHEGTASDGRPLVEVSGSGKLVGEGEPKPKFIIKPKSTPNDIGDYKTIDHPALRGWKWIGKTPEGADVMMQGELKVHPEIYDKLKNRLSTSWFRQNPVSRGLLNVQSTLKQSMMSISGFHQVQENLHSLGHRINPLNLEKLDFSEPVTKSLVEHGLQLADYNALSDFGEGLSSGRLLSKIPVVGSKLQAYNDWLFQENIPRLKLTMAKHALERNKERYAGAIAQGKITPDQVLELTASQANHAFGELPYKYWGRNPNLQDFYRTFLLAPDFLEARGGFVGQALKPGGLGVKGLLKNEQTQALALLALTQYITARIANQIINNDPHWEMKNAFRIISGNHAYSLRTVPGDVIHLLSDPRGFTYNRLSPMMGRGGIELATQRDYRGVKRDFFDQMKDLLKSGIPISFSHKNGQTILESFGNAFGVQNQHYDAIQNIQQRAQDFKSALGINSAYETIYDADEDKFKALRSALQEGNQKSMQKEFTKLKQIMTASKIREHFKLSLSRPFAGSKANDVKFYNSLDEIGKNELQEARDLRRARISMINSLQ